MTSIRFANIRAASILGAALVLLIGAGAASAFEVSNNSGSCLTVKLTCAKGGVNETVDPGQVGAACVVGDECQGTCNYQVWASCAKPKNPPDCTGNIDAGSGLQVDTAKPIKCVRIAG